MSIISDPEPITTNDLRTAAKRLRCEHSFPCQPPEGTLWAPGPCTHCGMPWDEREPLAGLPEPMREPLAVLLESAASTAQEHQVDPTYVGMPEFRLCRDCDEEECEGLRSFDRAATIARSILGGAR